MWKVETQEIIRPWGSCNPRVTESQNGRGWKGPLLGHLVQPSCRSRVTYSRLLYGAMERSSSQFRTGPSRSREQGRELLNLEENTFLFRLSIQKVEAAEGFSPPRESPGVIPSPPSFPGLLQTWTLRRGILCALCIRGRRRW